MKENELRVFVERVVNYFSTITQTQVTVGVPHIKPADQVMGEITGVIGLTGKRKGGVFFTASKAMLEDIVAGYLKIEKPDLASIKDLAGEIANTIAGNASKSFGADFQISVPIVFVGRPKQIDLPRNVPTFVIPIVWKTHKAFLVVGVE